MTLEILSETPVNVHQLKEILEKIKKRDGELNFRAAKTEEHLNHLETYKNTEELFTKIEKLDISRLRALHIHKIIDIMPATIKDLKLILQGHTISVTNDNMKKIVDTVTAFVGKK